MNERFFFIFKPKTYKCIEGEAIMDENRTPVACAKHNVTLTVQRRKNDSMVEKVCPFGDTRYEEILFRLNAKIK